MKRNIYSYSKLWMIFFVLMGAACTNQVEDAIPVSGQPIEFSVQSDWKEIPNTRLNDGKKQFEAGNKIQIFGFHKYSSEGEVKFMYSVDDPKKQRGQIVTLDDNNNWNYSPKRFWPKEGTLDFYASYPDYSVLNEGDKMTYVQPDFNPLGVDLLWGLATNRDCAEAETVPIWMVHALAKVNIFFDSSLGDIKQAKVSAYKAGDFSNAADNGVPLWNVKTDIIQATIPEKPTKIDDVTVFILPDRITGLILIKLDGTTEIDVSDKIQNLKFEAGKEYNLTISKGVQKNTNSRSIAMSVRCVSE
ncbi:MAG: fimbrillin family protein [Prevotella sp.]|jgi:hypothetical protein|nr:fimbrillin family protein [Prevotella sp.]